jgi:hypothetical protein
LHIGAIPYKRKPPNLQNLVLQKNKVETIKRWKTSVEFFGRLLVLIKAEQ